MSVGILMGNASAMGVVSLTLTPAAVGANTTAEQTFTCPGVLTSDVVFDITKPTTQAGLGIVNTRVSAANTIAVAFINATGGSLTPTAGEVYKLCWMRPDSTQTGVSA